MDQLPPELLHRICAFCDDGDVCSFRLACKAFARIGAEHVCDQAMVLYLTQRDLGRFEKLSRFPQLACNLQSLSLVTTTLDLPKLVYPERSRIASHTAWFRGQSPLEQYEHYASLCEDQEDMLNSNYDVRCLQHALTRFQNLRDLTLRTCSDAQATAAEDPFSSDKLGFYGTWDDRVGARHVDPVLLALSRSSTRLETLSIRNLHWRFFDREDTVLLQLMSSLGELRHFDLEISDAWCEEDRRDILQNRLDDEYYEASSWRNHRKNFRACRRVMQSGVLTRCLGLLQNLHTLKIGFPFWDDEPPSDEPIQRSALLHQVVHPGWTWTQLRSLSLCHIECSRQELLNLLARHRATLNELCLKNMYLQTTSWIPLLQGIRRTLYLKRVCICGIIEGQHERTGFEGLSQLWDLRVNEPLRLAVNEYCLEGGRVYGNMCPLTEENAASRE
ncbi:hypothetical protein BX600DRAFT_515644 [Xylariales sp. PMI_506]|nr:hypothetical protein BX600DRAFT_515644 [Xylariales sp. PMI_506]